MEERSAVGLLKAFIAAPAKSCLCKAELKGLNQQSWQTSQNSSEALEILLMKALRKAPEGFAFYAQKILSLIPPDITLDGLIKGGIMPLLIRMVKSNLLDAKNSGMAIMSILYQRTVEVELKQQVIQTLLDTLRVKSVGGSMNPPLNNNQKVSVVCCLANIYMNLSQLHSVDSNFHILVMNEIIIYCQKEEDLGIILATGKLIGYIFILFANRFKIDPSASFSTVEDTKVLRELIESGLKSTKCSVRTVFLTALSVLCSSSFPNCQYFLSETIFNIILELCGRGPGDPEFVIAVGLVATLSSMCQITKSKKGTLNAFDQNKGLIFTDPLHLSAGKLKDILRACDIFKTAHFQDDNVATNLAAGLMAEQHLLTIFRVFISIAQEGFNDIHYDLEEDRAIIFAKSTLLILRMQYFSHCRDMIKSSPNSGQVSSTILWSFFCLMSHSNSRRMDLGFIYRSLNLSNHLSGQCTHEILCFRSQTHLLLNLIICSSAETTVGIKVFLQRSLGIFSMALSHPFISSKGNRYAMQVLEATKVYVSRASLDQEDLEEIAKFAASQLYTLGFLATKEDVRRAAYRGFALLFSTSFFGEGQSIFSYMLMEQFSVLFRSGFENRSLNLDERAIAVLFDPQKVIEDSLLERRASSMQGKDLCVSNADRKKSIPRSSRKGAFGGVEEDSDWAERIKREKEQKVLEEINSAQHELRAAISSEVEMQRMKLLEYLHCFCLQIDGLAALSYCTPDVSLRCLGQIISCDQLWSTICLPFVLSRFQDSIFILLSSVGDSRLKNAAMDVAASIKLSQRHIFSSSFLCQALSNFMWLEGDICAEPSSELPSSCLRLLRVIDTAVDAHEDLLHPSIALLLYRVIRVLCSLPSILNCLELVLTALKRLWVDSLCIVVDDGQVILFSGQTMLADFLSVALGLLKKTTKFQSGLEALLTIISCNSLVLNEHDILPLIGTMGLHNEASSIRIVSANVLLNACRSGKLFSLASSNVLQSALWISRHDDAVKGTISIVLDQLNIMLPSISTVEILQQQLHSQHPILRNLTAQGLATAIGNYFGMGQTSLLKALIDKYIETIPNASIGKEQSTLSRMPINDNHDIHLRLRSNYSSVFLSMSELQVFDIEMLVDSPWFMSLMNFHIEYGVIDSDHEIRARMLKSVSLLVLKYGVRKLAELIQQFEESLDQKPSSGTNLVHFDLQYQCKVVLVGTLASFLDKSYPSLSRTLVLLTNTLNIPSESVQRSVSDCMVPIVQLLKGTEVVDQLVAKSMEKLLKSSTYGERRGAAFGLSSIIKGLGIPCLKQYNIINYLREQLSDGSVSGRQGALFAFECLSEKLGLLFEPYVVSIIDVLLENFSHSSDHVRDAARGAVKKIMTKLSAHGVKQLLTPVLATFNSESAWKTKQEALKMLGAMSNCAPKQLAACLPQVVACLTQASTDLHPKVRDSAKASLIEISSVVKNPEISQLSPVLLGALSDPSTKTKDALNALLQCEFMHTIDAAALSLIIPILSRALKDRSADLKRKAAAISSNIMSMVAEAGSLTGYVGGMLPGLKDCLIDPIPDVRASGAKALGCLCKDYDSAGLEHILAWLIETLQSSSSPVERSGAAQGLAALSGVRTGQSQLKILRTMFELKNGQSAAAREGLMWFLMFLPYSMKDEFPLYITDALSAVLMGLKDDIDSVRDVAMRAGKIIVSVLGVDHASRLAPALLECIFLEDWQIRFNSLQLLGDLLTLCSGNHLQLALSTTASEDVSVGHSSVLIALRTNIGLKLTDELLSALYICRSDMVIAVRSQAINIWKSIVVNTPRTLIEIMSTLVSSLMEKLVVPEEELKLTAGRSIMELMSKVGDKLICNLVPELSRKLIESVDNKKVKLGICFGLGEMLKACTARQLEEFLQLIMHMDKLLLCDSSAEVRAEAAKVFMSLYRCIGKVSYDAIVPTLVNAFEEDESKSDFALHGLKEIVFLKPRESLDYLIPKLVVNAMSVGSANALSLLAEASGQQIFYYYRIIVPSLVQQLVQLQNSEEGKASYVAVKKALSSVAATVSNNGLASFVSEVGPLMDADAENVVKSWGCWILGQFFSQCKANYDEYVTVFLKYLLSRIAENDHQILIALINAMNALVKAISLDVLASHVEFIRNCVSSTASTARYKTGQLKLLSVSGDFLLPLFCVEKSLDSFFAIFSHGLLVGNPHMKELCAEMIAECANMAEESVLRPTLIKTVGSLIRILGDRSTGGVKAAILLALLTLMKKGGSTLKAFVPQLQSTFVKSLNDPNRDVRTRAVKAICSLLSLGPRIDPLLADLSSLSSQVESHAIRLSVLDALWMVLNNMSNCSPQTILRIIETLNKLIFNEEDNVRLASARCLGAICSFAESAQILDLALDLVSGMKANEVDVEGKAWLRVSGKLLSLAALLQTCDRSLDEYQNEIFSLFLATKHDSKTSSKIGLLQAIIILLTCPKGEISANYRSLAQITLQNFVDFLVEMASPSSSTDQRMLAIAAMKQGCKSVYGVMSHQMRKIFPVLIQASKDIDLRIKYVAEDTAKLLIAGKAGEVHSGSTLFQQFISKAEDKELMRSVLDYQRFLSMSKAGGDRGAEESVLSVFNVTT